MQTILGSGGAIGIELAKALKPFTNEIRLVSRNPQKVNDTDFLLQADLLNESDVTKAIEGSDIVYVTIGFKYDVKVWQKNWPRFINYVINACETHKSKLVFFDNIYMYDPLYVSHMTEETPVNPSSKKGLVRAEVAQKIMDAIRAGRIEALIARSADFYGPSIQNTCMLTESVFKPLSSGKKANWMGDLHKKHAFTYTPDAGKATAILGNTPDAYNRVWHLPTAPNPPSGIEWIKMIAKSFGVKPGYMLAPKFVVRIMGLFIPVMREIVEMMYQYENDYIFLSHEFEKRFGFTPTSYEDGVRQIVDIDYKK